MISVIRFEKTQSSLPPLNAPGSSNVRRTAGAGAVGMPERNNPASAGTAVNGTAEKPVSFGPAEFPYIPEGYGPEELAARTRLEYAEPGKPVSGNSGPDEEDRVDEQTGDGEKTKSPAEEMEDAECETCKKRKYQDESNDPGVSFKTATKLDPEAAASAVRGHEQEHVIRERAKAEREDRRVVSQTVTYHTGICPECGRFYVSGGTTRTVTASDSSSDDSETDNSDEEKRDGIS